MVIFVVWPAFKALYVSLVKDSDKFVLCLVDFGPQSRKVLGWAAQNARDHGSDLVVLHSYRLKTTQRDQQLQQKRQLETEAVHKFETMKTSVPLLSQVPIRFSAEVGFEIDRLDMWLQHQSARMLVVDKENALRLQSDAGWREFIERLSVPMVLV